MPKLHHEKNLFKRKIIFLLVFLMNEIMIYFMGDELFFNLKIADIGSIIRIIIAILVVISIFYYLKEKAIKVEVS